MTIFNLGSVNIDHFYALPHLPAPGETLAATQHTLGLGGKGTNQSAAAARAGSRVFHIGAIGENDTWVRERIESFGVDCRYLRGVKYNTGHAIIYVDADGENTIILDPAANVQQDPEFVIEAIDSATSSDTLLIQNETNLRRHAASFALVKGMRVIYSAAPFSIQAARDLLPDVSLLVVNEVEAAQLCSALHVTLDKIPAPQVIVTLGSKGAMWRSNETGETIEVSSPKVKPVDTTAAGDTFIGYYAAGVDQGMSVQEALEFAVQAAALKVTRHGTADAIPTRDEVAKHFASV